MLDRRALLASDIRPEAVRTALLQHVDRRLGFYAGARYQCVVRKCLDGELQNGEGGDAQLNLRFAREVTAVLKGMFASL